MSLQDQYNLSTNGAFLQRVQAAIVHAAIAVQAEVINDAQTISLTGGPTGGTFTLTYSGQTTAAIAWNAVAATVQLALQSLSTIGTNNVAVTGGPGPATAWVATLTGTLAGCAHPVMTGTGTLLTGGVTPAVAIVHTTTGVSFALHPARAALASKILASPLSYAQLMAIGVADNATVLAEYPPPSYAISGVTVAVADADLQFAANSIFNSYS